MTTSLANITAMSAIAVALFLSFVADPVKSCSILFPDGIHVTNLRFVGEKRPRLAADITQYDSKTSSSKSKKNARINMRTGEVTKGNGRGTINKEVTPKPTKNAPKGYTLDYKKNSKTFVLTRPSGSGGPVKFAASDYNDEGGWNEGHSFFVDLDLARAYILYRAKSSSSRVVILNLNNGNIVAKQKHWGSKGKYLSHSGNPQIYENYGVASFPGSGADCVVSHFVYYDRSKVRFRYTVGVTESEVLVSKGSAPLKMLRTRHILDDDNSYKPRAYWIDSINLKTGKKKTKKLNYNDIQDFF